MHRALPLLALLLAPLAAAAPEQVHLGLPSDDPAREASVLFVDLQAAGPPPVRLDTPEGVREFPSERVLGPGLGPTYEARLTGLSPATTYAYHVGDETFTFRTAPEGPAPFTFVALADMGVSERAAQTVEAIEALGPDFVLHNGDISYAEGRQTEWVAWFNLVEPVAATRPWVTALGNHETYSGTSLTEATTVAGDDKRVSSPVELEFYKQRFGLPGNELWYSFGWGGAHFVALDTFSEADISSAQLDWLEADLAAHASATWTIVFLHEPPYTSGANHAPSQRVQERIVPILERHGVDLVLAGHEHNYERSWPLRGGEPVAWENVTQEGNGTFYVVTGGGGQSLYGFKPEAPAWSAARMSAYHVVAVTVTPDALEGRYVGIDGKAFADAFRLEKPAATRAANVEEPMPDAAIPSPSLGVLALVLVGAALLARRLRA